jgi:hypothetical protein
MQMVGSSRRRSEIFILQVAQIGGAKLGFAEDPEGAWVDHDVYFDRAEADAVAKIHETAPVESAEGHDITGEVVTVARVVTMDELRAEFGDQRVNQVTTMFRGRFSELFGPAREADGHDEAS